MRAHVQQRLRIEPRDRRRRNVADIVRARPARAHPQRGQLVQHRHQVLRLKLANLHVRPRRQVHAPRAPLFRHLRQAAHLRRRQHRARNARAQHERVLRGRDVKEPMELEPVRALRVRRLVFVRMRQQVVPRVQRVALVLPKLLAAQVVERGAMEQCRLVLHARGRVGRNLPRGGMPGEGHALGRAGEKAFQVLLLLERERLAGCRLGRSRLHGVGEMR